MGAHLFCCTCSERTTKNGLKLRQGKFRLGIRKKKYFSIWVVRHWNRFVRDVMESPSLEVCKGHLNMVLVYGLQWQCWVDGWTG